MMSLKDLSTVVPQDGQGRFYRYLHPETAHWSEGRDYWSFIETCKAHRRANELPIPLDFEAQVQDQLCAQLPPELCSHDQSGLKSVDTRFSLGDVVDAMKVFMSWALTGFENVSQEEAESRAATCVRCFYNVDASGCGACGGMAKLVTGIFSSKKTSQDSRLKVCANCRCILKVKVHVPLKPILDNESPERLAAYPPFCWIQTAA